MMEAVARVRVYINAVFAALCVAAGAVALAGVDACGQTTTRKGRLVRRVATEDPVAPADTLTAGDIVLLYAADSARIDDGLLLRDYDKPLRSLLESFFVTNRFDTPISGITLDVEYVDSRGSMLHRRTIRVKCEVPPGETRQLYVRAWDRHYTHYYKYTRIRRNVAAAVPYDVVIRPVSVAFPYQPRQ